jgi:hypothetical protein
VSNDVKHILRAYIAAGGAKMDESSYQKYKLAMLLDWMIVKDVFELVRERIIPINQEYVKKVYYPDELICKSIDCMFSTECIESAIDHLTEHFPEYFTDTGVGTMKGIPKVKVVSSL